MKLGRANIDATLSAAANRGDVEIVSRPVLLASNNQEARFLVGSQRRSCNSVAVCRPRHRSAIR